MSISMPGDIPHSSFVCLTPCSPTKLLNTAHWLTCEINEKENSYRESGYVRPSYRSTHIFTEFLSQRIVITIATFLFPSDIQSTLFILTITNNSLDVCLSVCLSFCLFQSHESIKRLEEWAVDPVTLQPWTHVFDEPLLQLGPGGYVITVERQFKVILWGVALSSISRILQKKVMSEDTTTVLITVDETINC